MTKKMRKIAVLTMIAILVIAAIPASAATKKSKTKTKKQKVEQVVKDVKDLGFKENDTVTKIIKDLLNGKIATEPGGDTYYDGEYFWYLGSTGYYFRFDKYGYKTYQVEKDKSQEIFAQKKLWDGIITGVDSYVDKEDAEIVARFILSYKDLTNGSTRQQAELAWCLINNCCDGTYDFMEALKSFEDYDYKADLTTKAGKKALKIAKDVLFRRYVEKHSSTTKVGRVLPSNYSWMWIQGGKVYLRASKNGKNWNHSSESPY